MTKKGSGKVDLRVLVWGLLLVVIFIYLHVPAGGLIGATLGIGAANVLLDRELRLPAIMYRLAQVGIGTTIGLRFTRDMINKFSEIYVPVLIFSVLIVLSGILLALLLSKVTRWDLSTCLLCSAPGGLSQMIVIGEAIGADVVKVCFFRLPAC